MSITTKTRDGGSVPRSSASRSRHRIGRILTPTVGLVGAITAWQAVIRIFNVPIYLVPAPTDVWRALVDNWQLIATNIGPTAYESFLGFALGNLAALVFAVLFVHSGFLERLLFPVVVALRTVPIIAIAPILIIIFGNGAAPKVVIAALISFFPTLMNAIVGLKSVDPKTVELMQVLSARPWEIFFKVRVYVALPFIFSALKIATGNCVLGAVVGEWIGANHGLGYLIIQSTFDFNTTLLYATMLVVSVLAVGSFALVSLAERFVMPWKVAEKR